MGGDRTVLGRARKAEAMQACPERQTAAASTMLTPGRVMISALLVMAMVVSLGAWSASGCGAVRTDALTYRYAQGPGLVLWCGPLTGPVLAACPWLFAGAGLAFIAGSLWLAWREGRTPR